MPTVLEVVVLLGLSTGFYLAAVSRARAWGMTVKGAFDLYRWVLLEALGYKQRPKTLEEEQVLWESISMRLILSDLSYVAHPGYEKDERAISVRAEPEEVPLEISRGVNQLSPTGGLTITVRVRNADSRQSVRALTVTEVLPSDWLYEWDSATSSSGPVQVFGANPYHFQIGALGPTGETLLTYRVVTLPARIPDIRKEKVTYA